MAPEYGATCGFFPVDARDARATSTTTGREPDRVALVEAYAKAQGMFRTDDTPDPVFTDTLELDLATVVPSLAGPKRPQDRVPLSDADTAFDVALAKMRDVNGADGFDMDEEGGGSVPSLLKTSPVEGKDYELGRRRRGDRRDHLLHQHLQPERADRRRPAGPQRPREGPDDRSRG